MPLSNTAKKQNTGANKTTGSNKASSFLQQRAEEERRIAAQNYNPSAAAQRQNFLLESYKKGLQEMRADVPHSTMTRDQRDAGIRKSYQNRTPTGKYQSLMTEATRLKDLQDQLEKTSSASGKMAETESYRLAGQYETLAGQYQKSAKEYDTFREEYMKDQNARNAMNTAFENYKAALENVQNTPTEILSAAAAPWYTDEEFAQAAQQQNATRQDADKRLKEYEDARDEYLDYIEQYPFYDMSSAEAASLKNQLDEDMENLKISTTPASFADDIEAVRNVVAGKIYYPRENEEQFAKLGTDKTAQATYDSLEDAKKDLQIIGELRAQTSQGAPVFSNIEDMEANYAYIEEKYGIKLESQEQFDNDILELERTLQERIASGAETLGESGYNYDRMSRYQDVQRKAKEYQQQVQNIQDIVNRDKGSAVAANVLSVASMPLQSVDLVRKLFSTAGHNDINDLENYEPMNPYDMPFTTFTNTVRQTTAQNIKDSAKRDWVGNVEAFLYQTGMSAVDSLVAATTLGPITTIAFGGAAAATYMQEAAQKGASNTQIISAGILTGVAEAFFEYFSLEHLNKMKPDTFKQWMIDIGVQGLTEASEEIFTEIADIITDNAIMRGLSDNAQAVKEYMAQGMSREKAKQKVFLDNLADVGLAGLGGLLSGTVGAGLKGAVTVAGQAKFDSNYAAAVNESEGGVQALIESGLESKADTKSYKLAKAAQEKINSGKSLTTSEINELRSANDRAMEAETKDIAEQYNMDERAAEDLLDSYSRYTQQADEPIPLKSYAEEFQIAYEYGRRGVSQEYANERRYTPDLSNNALQTAYDAGRRSSMIEEGRAIASQTETEYNGSQRQEAENGEVYLRRSGERIDGTYTGRTVQELESGTGQNQSGRSAEGRPADGEAARLTYEGRAVNTASLGIEDGSTTDSVYVVTGGDTEATRQARKIAQDNGYDLVLFGGGNLTVDGESVRAHIDTDSGRVLVRADHPQFTALQLIRHEDGHGMIARGEVDSKVVRERMNQKIGKANVDGAANLYAAAYSGTTLNEDEIWEEIICDSLGDMNIFAPVEEVSGPIEDFLKVLKGVTQESRTESRGPPERTTKASRETGRRAQRGRSIEMETMENNRFERLRQFGDDLPAEWYAFTRSNFYIYSNQSFTNYTILVTARITDGNKAAIRNFVKDIHDGTYDSSKTFDRWTDNFRRGRGRDSWHSIRSGETRTARRTDGVDVRTRGSENTGDTAENRGNSREVTGKASREVDTSMSMEQARDMIQRAFVLSGIKEWYDGEYRNGDEWARAQGSDEVAMYIENEYTLQEKYLNKIPALMDGDISVEEIVEAYLDGTLTGTVAKPKAQRLDTTQRTEYNDSRFYAPQSYEGENVTALYETANQRATNTNRDEVNAARAKLLFIAHDANVAETLGISQAEFNKKLRAWSRYSKNALDISKRINAGVPTANRWTGIQNCAIINQMAVSDEDILHMVKDITGKSSEYKRQYIGRTMLALDTHIDWSNLSFEFKGGGFENRSSTRGMYSQNKISIANSGYANTVAHEMGHALDAIWGREVFSEATSKSGDTFLTDTALRPDLITDAETRQFYNNFRAFVDNITDSSDIRSGYTADVKEVFARFVAKFVEFTDVTAGNNFYQESSFYHDRFNSSQYLEFARLLQEKAMLDAKRARATGKASREIDAEYLELAKDPEGNRTELQRMVDEAARSAGYTVEGWHGTNAQFNEFNPRYIGDDNKLGIGFYFSKDKLQYDYAAKIKALLRVTNPITDNSHDISAKTWNSFFEKTGIGQIDIDGQLDLGTYVRASYEFRGNKNVFLTEFMRLTGKDGIISDDRNSIVMFSPENIKSADPVTYDDAGNVIPLSERFNTQNPDIRFSREMQQFSDLAEQNTALREKLSEVTELANRKTQQAEYWRGQTRTTKEPTLRQDDVNRVTRTILQNYDSTLKVGDVSEDIKNLGEFILRGGDKGDSLNWTTVKERARSIAERIIDSAEALEEGSDPETYRAIRRYFLDNKIAYVDNGDIPDFNDFRRRNMGRITFSKDGTPIDELWGELNSRFGEELFPSDIINPTDQILQAVNVLQTMKPEYSNPFRLYTAEATEYCANEIIDRVLDENVRQTAPTFADRMNARIESERARGAQRVSELRQQKNQRIAEIEERGRERLRNYREARSRTQLRRDIRAVADDLNSRLKNPTERRYIPANLVRGVVDLMETIDFTTTINKDGSVRELGKTTRAKVDALNTMYERLKSDPDYSYAYDPIVKDMITKLAEDIGDTPVNNMSRGQLEETLNTLKAIRQTAVDGVKLIDSEFKKNIFDTGRVLITETNAAAPMLKGWAGDFLNWQLSPDRFFERLAGFKKDSDWSKVAAMFRDGTEKKLSVERDFYNTFRDLTENDSFKTLGNTKRLFDIGLVDENGQPVKITKGMMLSVYMHLLSEDNRRGFMFGGFTVPDIQKYYNGKVADSYARGSVSTRGAGADLALLGDDLRRVERQIEETTDGNQRRQLEAERAELEDRMEARLIDAEAELDEMMRRIESQMSQYDRDLIERAGQWYDGKSRNYINDTTMSIYGIKKAAVDHYYTIHRDTAFVNTDFESISKNLNLENWGSLKDRVQSAAPILLTDIGYELNNHVNQLASYVGYATAQRNFGKLFNVSIRSSTGQRISVQKAVERNFGAGDAKLGVTGSKYIENLIGSIVGTRQRNDILSGLYSNVARGSLTLNLRVAMSQLASIPTAAGEVGWGPMAKGFARGLKIATSTNLKQRLAQDNVFFWQRYRGEGGMREFADMKNSNNAIDRAWNRLADTKVGRRLFNWCQDFDVFATSTMWAMAEDYVAKNTELKKGTEEFKAAVSNKYTDIIRKTQPNYTTTERSDLLRDNRGGIKLLTMFKTQANQNFNMLYESNARLRKYTQDYKHGRNGVTQADVRQAKKDFANNATALFIGAGIAFVGLRALANAIMYAVGSWRDDDDEVTVESTMNALLGEYISTQANMFTFGSEFYNIVNSVVNGKYYSGISDSGMSLISGAVEEFVKVAQKAADENKDVSAADIEKFGTKLSSLLGLPYANVKRLFGGIGNWVEDIQNGEAFSFEAGANRSNTVQYHRMWEAIQNGDSEKYDKVFEEAVEQLVENGKTREEAEKAIRSGLKAQIKDAYLDDEIDQDAAIGRLTEYTGAEENDAYFTVDKWQYDADNTDDDVNYTRYVDVYDALLKGEGIDAAIKELTDHGYDEKTVRSQIRSKLKEYYMGTEDEGQKLTKQKTLDYLQKYAGVERTKALETVDEWTCKLATGIAYDDLKQEFQSGNVTQSKAKEMLKKYGGYSEQDALAKVRYWEFQAKYPKYDMSEDAVAKYYSDVQKTGISIGTYADYYVKQKACKGTDNDGDGKTDSGSKKAEILKVIDALPITNAQKDALYDLNGWSDRTRNEAPWH